MKITTLLFSTLLLLGGASAFSPPEVLSLSVLGGEFDELNAEYQTALATWEEQADASEGKVPAHPATAFWPRFDTLSKGGDGESKLWLVTHLKEAKVVKSKDRKAVLHGLFTELTSEFNDENWFGEVLQNLAASARVLGEEATLKFFDTVIEETIDNNNQAGALFLAGRLMKQSSDETLRARGESYLVRIEKELADTSWMQSVKDLRAWEAVQVGQVAPNFKGKTNDGFEFQLSEYRGQVVLLDFYGFW